MHSCSALGMDVRMKECRLHVLQLRSWRSRFSCYAIASFSTHDAAAAIYSFNLPLAFSAPISLHNIVFPAHAPQLTSHITLHVCPPAPSPSPPQKPHAAEPTHPSGPRKDPISAAARPHSHNRDGTSSAAHSHSHSRDTARAAVARLLPGGELPEAALVFVENRPSRDDAPGGELRRQFAAGVAWVLDALINAHEDKKIKSAARKLLACEYFTRNLDAYDRPWRTTLRPGLGARLVSLGKVLAADYDANNMGEQMSTAAVTAAVGKPEDHPLARALNGSRAVTQIDMLPCCAPVDFSRLWEHPEEVYSHALLIVAASLDAAFQHDVATIIGTHNTSYNGGRGTATHGAAPPKASARVKTKAASDYRYRPKPVGQNNIDVVRTLITAETPRELLDVASVLSKAFGGVVKVKSPPSPHRNHAPPQVKSPLSPHRTHAPPLRAA
jgi:hypothetical protein